jgi:hypothetical protein
MDGEKVGPKLGGILGLFLAVGFPPDLWLSSMDMLVGFPAKWRWGLGFSWIGVLESILGVLVALFFILINFLVEN